MKYLILVLSVASLSFSSQLNAQQGSVYIGGQMSFNYSINSSTTPKTIQIGGSVSSEMGTFLKDNIQLGAGLRFATSSIEIEDISKMNNSSYGLTVYCRRFFLEGDFKPFVGLNTHFNFGQSVWKDLSTPSTISNSRFADYGINLNVGFAYALHPQFCVVGSFGFVGLSATTRFNANQSSTTDFNAGFDLSSLGNRFNVGLYYTFKERN